MTVVTYGLKSSPYNAVRTLIQCGRDAIKEFPTVSDRIIKDFYMDDIFTGADSIDEAIELAKDIDIILKSSGFILRDWQSNFEEIKIAMGSDEDKQILLIENEKAKVLGLVWNVKKDRFTYKVNVPDFDREKITKRVVLSYNMQLYDPNGYISPITIVCREMMQEIWKLKEIDWDNEVPEIIVNKWRRYWNDMHYLERFEIPRWIETKNYSKVHLHGFADASKKAYGAVIYVQTTDENGINHSTILISKAKVTPLKVVTIPRLELTAAELLSRMLKRTIEVMEWKDISYTLWTDSEITWKWLQGEPYEYETFVANRVASIQQNTDVRSWKVVNTKENPADILTRGLDAKDLIDNKFWLHGPEWLVKSEDQWPKCVIDKKDKTEEEKLIMIITEKDENQLTIYSKENEETVLLINYAHSLDKLINITARVFQFINKLKEAIHNKTKIRQSKRRKIEENTNLTIEERQKAFEYHLKNAQNIAFGKEIAYINKGKKFLPEKSKLKALRPYLDKTTKILHVGGRIDEALCTGEMKHPMIVPKDSRLGWLILEEAHRKTKHGGTQLMIQYIQQKYWIPSVRDTARKFILDCYTCARYAKRYGDQIMADLPADRIRPGKPFLHCGIDYAGPFEIKEFDRLGKQIFKRKCWTVMIVCLKTRAVHIDLVTSLSTIAFIQCYDRFIARFIQKILRKDLFR